MSGIVVAADKIVFGEPGPFDSRRRQTRRQERHEVERGHDTFSLCGTVGQPYFPRHQTRPILCRWREARTGAIRPSIRKKTRLSRRAPRRRGRIRRCSTIRWRTCSIRPSARARRDLARRPGLSPRPTIPGIAAPTLLMRIARARRSRADSANRRSRITSARHPCRSASSIPIWRKRWGLRRTTARTPILPGSSSTARNPPAPGRAPHRTKAA